MCGQYFSKLTAAARGAKIQKSAADGQCRDDHRYSGKRFILAALKECISISHVIGSMDEALRGVVADNKAGASCVPRRVMPRVARWLPVGAARDRHSRPARRSRASASSPSTEKYTTISLVHRRSLLPRRAAKAAAPND